MIESFQGVFMMYLYVGSIVAIMCIYISVLIDNCPSLTGPRVRNIQVCQWYNDVNVSNFALQDHKEMTDAENGSVASFGTLRRAHISRNKVSRTSFYLRVGALGKAYFLISKISNLASVLKMLPQLCSICLIFHSNSC